MQYRYKVIFAFLLVILAVFCIYIYKYVNIGDEIVSNEFMVIVDKTHSKYSPNNRFSITAKKLYGVDTNSFDIFIDDENVWNLVEINSSYFVVYEIRQNINKLRQIKSYIPPATESSMN